MVRIFSNCIRIRFSLKEFLSVRIRFHISISVTDLYLNTKKLHFYDVHIHYNFIWQKLTLSVSDSVFEHKYENKYDISDIRPYPIRFHPYSRCTSPRQNQYLKIEFALKPNELPWHSIYQTS